MKYLIFLFASFIFSFNHPDDRDIVWKSNIITFPLLDYNAIPKDLLSKTIGLTCRGFTKDKKDNFIRGQVLKYKIIIIRKELVVGVYYNDATLYTKETINMFLNLESGDLVLFCDIKTSNYNRTVEYEGEPLTIRIK